MRSMRQNARLLLIAALLLGVIGCNSGASSSKATQVPDIATATVAQSEKIGTSTALAVAIPAATQAAIAIPCDAVTVPTRSAAVFTRVAAGSPQAQVAP